MAKSKKNIQKPAPDLEEKDVKISADRKKQIRLGFGITLLFIGVFVTLSIISYCFSWQADQDKLLSGKGWSEFLFHDKTPVSNWCGRFGAYIGHSLVYEGVGIASLAIGLAICLVAIKVLYAKRRLPIARYFRWISILLLLVAPTLTYLMPSASFPFGGAWGNEAITYMNGFLGTAGTGLVLLAIIAFFAFVIFALDISPLLKRARTTAKKVADVASAITPDLSKRKTEEEPEEKEEDEATPNNTPSAISNTLKNDTETHTLQIDEEDSSQQVEMLLTEKEPQQKQQSINDLYANKQEDTEIELEPTTPPIVEEQPIAQQVTPEPEPEYEDEPPVKDDMELSFEVTKKEEEKTVPANGDHISIEDNEPYAPELDLPDYKFPTLDILTKRSQESIVLDKEELEKNKNQIIQTLKSFGIEIQRISATVGPTVTLYEIVPAEGVRISKIRNLEDDIALNLAALGIRIIAPIPGKGTIGIEVPNANKQIVGIRSLLASEKFATTKMSLPIALGKKIDNENYIVDLATMPHLLMAGATGQGKSVGINTILVSLLYKKHPAQLKFVMVDPKKVELSVYRTIEKHFLAKLPNEEEAIITDTKKVINTLNALCIEMDNRYELLKQARARNIKEYNEKFVKRRLNPENGHQYLPFIVLVVDEFADLIMTAGKEVEMPIARLAQLARAVGIHLIIATQRPSVNVITGTIKANFPARIAFKVSAKVDSRTILDAGGAEQLIGRGDMLISFGSEILRLQCAFVDTPEVEEIAEFIGEQRGYLSAFELPEYEGEDGGGNAMADLTNRDKLFEDCARSVVQSQSGSTSMLQRRFNLGYNRAGRIMDQLEAAGIVGPAMGSKPREVMMSTETELEQFLNSL